MAAAFPKKKCGTFLKISRYPIHLSILADHPFLELHAVGASERSANKKYKDAVNWKQASPMSEKLSNLVMRDCKPEHFSDCDLVFSGLNSDVAGETGMWYQMYQI